MKRKFRVTVDNETFLVEVEEIIDEGIASESNIAKATRPTRTVQGRFEHPESMAEVGVVIAPIPGVVSDLRVSKGDKVEAGSVLLLLEAMKMENEIYTPSEGVVKEIFVEVGQQVSRGERLVLVS
jgi:biotin carboxyl carrier protein